MLDESSGIPFSPIRSTLQHVVGMGIPLCRANVHVMLRSLALCSPFDVLGAEASGAKVWPSFPSVTIGARPKKIVVSEFFPGVPTEGPQPLLTQARDTTAHVFHVFGNSDSRRLR